jgi:transposase
VSWVCQRPVVKTATVPAEPASLAVSVPQWFPGATLSSAYEAGLSGFVLHRALPQAGRTHRVVKPAAVAVAAHDKVTTDRRDAKKLAMDLADGRLRGLSVPTEAEDLARLLPRTRAPLVEPRAPMTRQSTAKRHQLGLIPPGSRGVMSRRYVRERAAGALPPARQARRPLLAAQWRFATRQRLERRRLLRAQAQAQEQSDQVDRRVPGMGEGVARTVATALGARSRFTQERALGSDPGLRPREYASGASMRRGPSRRPGVSRLRHGLGATAWRALPGAPSLHAMFERLAATRGTQRAMVASARRRMGRIRAWCRHGPT